MKIVKEEAFEEKVNVWECQCGEKLVELDEAVRLQKKRRLSILQFQPTHWGRNSRKASQEMDELLYG